MYYVYVLKSRIKKWTYIGSTDNLKVRFVDHKDGRVKSTKPYRPLELIYYEAYKNKNDARKRELELKNQSQKKEILFRQIANSLNMASSSNG